MLENSQENSSKSENELNEENKISTENTVDTKNDVINFENQSSNNDDEEDQDEVFDDYSEHTIEELVATLKKIIENNPVQSIKSSVDQIKNTFNEKFGALLADKKEAFLEDGGESIDFQFSHPSKSEFNRLLFEYKNKREAHYASIEKQLNENLEKRLQLIEDLKSLIDEAEVTTMYKNFKEIQDQWKLIGGVPKSTYNDTWKTYQHHVERFYDLLHLSNDFRELDFKNNLTEKLKLIEKAEALSEEKDINFAAKQLQELHKIWKEDIGPVSRDIREEVWQKFSEATKKIHDKRHEYFKEIHSKYDELIEKKALVIEEIKAIDVSKNKNHNDWQVTIDELETLRKKYFDLGKLPYAKSEEIWQKFKNATKKINSAKNKFYKEEKSEQQENLRKKMDLIALAESLKDSEDWEMATNTMKKIQSDWKKIGHVPRKFSDEIWKRFKAACNFYFNRYHKQKNSISKDQQAIVDKKEAFLESIKSNKNITKEIIIDAMKSWQDFGKLPKNAKQVDVKFNKFIDAALDNLSIDKTEINILKFANLIDSYVAENDFKKLDSEQLFIRKKIDEIVREIQQLENNLSFFSISNKNNPLVLNVKKQVTTFKDELAIWKEKLEYLKKIDY